MITTLWFDILESQNSYGGKKITEYFIEAKKKIIGQISDAVKNKKNIKFTIGIFQNSKPEFYLIGENGLEEFKKYHYEIGSITKIFTGLLTSKAYIKGHIDINSPISEYLKELDVSKHLPTVKQIITHTSGFEYNPKEEDGEDILPKINPFIDVKNEQVIDEINTMNLKDIEYPFCYSNIGAATIGILLESVYGKPYCFLLDDYLAEIGLGNTYTLNPPYDIEGVRPNGTKDGHWEWKEQSSYNAAGCLVSTAEDMLKLGKLLLDRKEEYIEQALIPLSSHKNRDKIRNTGFFILSYPKDNIFYHDGGTGCFNSVLSVNSKSNIAVVCLSNSYMDIIGQSLQFTRLLSGQF